MTRTYNRDDLINLAGSLPPGSLPEGVTPEEAIVSLEGAFASAFIRAAKVDRP